MYYGSPFYIASLLLLLGLGAAAWLLLRHRSQRTCYWVILGLMLLNLGQHLFKPFIYPQYMGQGITHNFTAYNMCATLIILSPLAMLSKSRFLKNFVFFTGTVAGIAAIAVPYWFIGQEISELGWEYVRFYLCHGLLFVNSLLPLVLGLHRPAVHEFWHISAGFFMALCIILINDFICMALGLYGGHSIETFYQSMLRINPCAMMGAKGPAWVLDIVKIFSPPVFLGDNPAGVYVPVLWYAIPLFLGLSLVSVSLFAWIDRKTICAAWKRLHNKR